MPFSEKWTEVLRCPYCALTGVASLSQRESDGSPSNIKAMPVGFVRISTQYGETFYCVTCDRAAQSEVR
jgi:hypothetical protein